MKATLNKNKIEISFTYDPMLISFVKSLDGRKYNPGTKTWFIPLSSGSKTFDLLEKRGFSISEELREAVKADEDAARVAEELSESSDAEFSTNLPLYPYQRVGAEFLRHIGSGILGDDVGLGKTIQAIAVADSVGAQKVLIFCPASVKYQWADEIEKFLPGEKSVVIEGSPKKRKELWSSETASSETAKGDYRFYIANYELLLRDADVMDKDWDLIIADEATKISNPQAKQSKAIKKLNSKRRIAMTGTPISNRANEIWNLIDWTQPGYLDSYWNFMEKYCVKNYFGGIDGYQNLDELSNKIKRFMIRRMKKDVLTELPKKIETQVSFRLSNEEKKLYDNIKKEILFEIQETDINKLENPMTIQYTLTKMLRLKQLVNSCELLGENNKSTKLEVLKEKLSETMADDRKAIIFTQFSEMADILERELEDYNPLVISGKSKEEYHKIVEKFNKDDKYRILIMTSAGQYGLNVQRASIVFHYDLEWSLAKLVQREGRAYRLGQENSVQIFTLVARGTIDDYIKKVLFEKESLSKNLLQDEKQLTINDIKEMLNNEK